MPPIDRPTAKIPNHQQRSMSTEMLHFGVLRCELMHFTQFFNLFIYLENWCINFFSVVFFIIYLFIYLFFCSLDDQRRCQQPKRNEIAN